MINRGPGFKSWWGLAFFQSVYTWLPFFSSIIMIIMIIIIIIMIIIIIIIMIIIMMVTSRTRVIPRTFKGFWKVY